MLPNATAVLVLGICSIVFSCFFVGAILGIIGLVLGAKAKKVYKASPNLYEGYGQVERRIYYVNNWYLSWRPISHLLDHLGDHTWHSILCLLVRYGQLDH